MRSIFLLAMIATVAVTVGCGDDGGSEPDNLIANPGSALGGTPNPPSGQVFEHLEGQLPAEFPPDFPVYEGAEIARGDTLNDRFAIDLRSSDEMEVVVEFYRTRLATSPWETLQEEPGDGSMIFKYKSEDERYSGEVAIGKLQQLTWILIAMDRPE